MFIGSDENRTIRERSLSENIGIVDLVFWNQMRSAQLCRNCFKNAVTDGDEIERPIEARVSG